MADDSSDPCWGNSFCLASAALDLKLKLDLFDSIHYDNNKQKKPATRHATRLRAAVPVHKIIIIITL